MLAALGALFGAAGKRGLADFTLDKIQRCSKLRQSHQFSPFLPPFDLHETFIMDALFNNPLPQRLGRDWAIFLAVRPQDSIHGADYGTGVPKKSIPIFMIIISYNIEHIIEHKRGRTITQACVYAESVKSLDGIRERAKRHLAGIKVVGIVVIGCGSPQHDENNGKGTEPAQRHAGRRKRS